MSEDQGTDAAVIQFGIPAAKKKAARSSGKLVSNGWYQGAVKSIGATRERVLHQISQRPRRKRKAEPKAVRVAGVIIDQAVACPSCGEPTRLSERARFECKQCGREVTTEEALRALEISESSVANVRSGP